jgi:hypothetical protein
MQMGERVGSSNLGLQQAAVGPRGSRTYFSVRGERRINVVLWYRLVGKELTAIKVRKIGLPFRR